MAYDNTPIRNGQFTQTRPYVGWTTCPKCSQPALLVGFLGHYGTCSNCGPWDSLDRFGAGRKTERVCEKSVGSTCPNCGIEAGIGQDIEGPYCLSCDNSL